MTEPQPRRTSRTGMSLDRRPTEEWSPATVGPTVELRCRECPGGKVRRRIPSRRSRNSMTRIRARDSRRGRPNHRARAHRV